MELFPVAFTLVLTGGPCGGKTSSLAVLKKALTERGYRTFCAPEVPTMFLSNGGEYPGHDGGERLIMWETAIIQLQRQLAGKPLRPDRLQGGHSEHGLDAFW